MTAKSHMNAFHPDEVQAYELLDSGNGRKLESIGPVRVERQASLALWRPTLSRDAWKNVHAVHVRSEKGGGHWDTKKKFPETWLSRVGPFVVHTKLTSFGHLGYFVEQAQEWDWCSRSIPAL